MQVKSFRAPTIAQALDLVRKDLGEDAIILGNKKVPVSSTECHIEVMAAVEPDPPRAAAAQTASSKPVPDTQIRSDIQEIKDLLSLLLSSKDYFAQLQLEQPLADIYYSLLSRGLDEKQTFLYLKKALLQLDGEPVSKFKIIEAFCHQLLEKIKFSRPFHSGSSHNGSFRVFSFVGPTGVGKTTTLAKIAAYLKIKRQINVGLISIDTYRIGAVDQLKTYANILGMPMLVAQSKSEFQKAKDQLRDRDVILVDTIGKNFLKKDHITDLQDAFSDCGKMHHFLVLSATAKDSDLKQTVLHFGPMDINSIIFTKVDETMSHGCIINQLLRFPHALSYLGTGQRVPEDIEAASHKRLLSLLFPSGNGSIGKE